VEQVNPQEPPPQVAEAFAGGVQGVQAVPQVFTSVFETQAPLHAGCPETHSQEWLDSSHDSLAPHWLVLPHP
jgi:hypothetical protein